MSMATELSPGGTSEKVMAHNLPNLRKTLIYTSKKVNKFFLKEERFQINNLTPYLKKLEEQSKLNPKQATRGNNKGPTREPSHPSSSMTNRDIDLIKKQKTSHKEKPKTKWMYC